MAAMRQIAEMVEVPSLVWSPMPLPILMKVGRGGADEAGRLADLLGRQAGDGGRPLRRELTHMIGQLVEAVAPLGHEVGIVELLGRSGRSGWPAPGRSRCPASRAATCRPSFPEDRAWGGCRSYFVPLSSAFRMARGVPWFTPEFSALAPQLTMRRVFCQSSGAMLKKPTVTLAAAMRGVAQMALCMIVGAAVHVQEPAPQRAQHRPILGREDAVGLGSVLWPWSR